MIEIGNEFEQRDGGGSEATISRSSRSGLRPVLSTIAVLACGCGVLAAVWRAAADENRCEAIAAVKALEGARDSAERVEAIRDLVRSVVIDGPIVIPPLICSLSDPQAEVRVEAARSLGPATSAAALSGRDGDLVPSATTALTRSLDDQEPAVRIAAIFSLGSIAASKNPSGVIDPQNLVDALATMLGDPDPTVRASTIAALGVAGPAAAPDPPPALIAALDDESSFNRAAAVHALARFPQSRDDCLIATNPVK